MSRLIDGDLVITPLIDAKRQIGPTSIDIRLGFEFGVFNITKFAFLDPLTHKERLRSQVDEYVTKIHRGPMEPFILHPGEFILGSTLEYFRIPRDLAGRLEGRSTWGRLGLQVHSTAGFVDPGFEGILTFELANVGKGALSLFPGVRIAQMCFYRTNPTAIPYVEKVGAKYFGRLGTSGSLFYVDHEFDAIRRFWEKKAMTQAQEAGERDLLLDALSRGLEKSGHDLSVEERNGVLGFLVGSGVISEGVGGEGARKDVIRLTRAGGESRKWENVLFDLGKLGKLGGNLIIGSASAVSLPWTLPFFLIVIIQEVREMRSVGLSEDLASVLWALVGCGDGSVIEAGQLLEAVNQVRAREGRTTIDSEELQAFLEDLADLGCVSQSEAGEWFLREKVEIRVDRNRRQLLQ